jgi:hypothetical protein
MTARKSAPRPAAQKATVLIKKLLGKSSPAEQDLSPSTDANGRHERIAARAYALYAERGYRQGCGLEDWLDAEREIVTHELQT